MCNLYSLTKGQAAIRDWFRAQHDLTGNLPLFPGIFPDQMAPIVRNGADAERELVMARWGMPGPPQFGGAPITNIRNVASPHWRGWLCPGRRLEPRTRSTLRQRRRRRYCTICACRPIMQQENRGATSDAMGPK
jgi:hypothetical protein